MPAQEPSYPAAPWRDRGAMPMRHAPGPATTAGSSHPPARCWGPVQCRGCQSTEVAQAPLGMSQSNVPVQPEDRQKDSTEETSYP